MPDLYNAEQQQMYARPTEAFFSARSTPRHSNVMPPRDSATAVHTNTSAMQFSSEEEQELHTLTTSLNASAMESYPNHVLLLILKNKCEATLKMLEKVNRMENYFSQIRYMEGYIESELTPLFNKSFLTQENPTNNLQEDVMNTKKFIEKVEKMVQFLETNDSLYLESILHFNQVVQNTYYRHADQEYTIEKFKRALLTPQNNNNNNKENGHSFTDALLLLLSKLLISLETNENTLHRKISGLQQIIKEDLLYVNPNGNINHTEEAPRSGGVAVMCFPHPDQPGQETFYATKNFKKTLFSFLQHVQLFTQNILTRLVHIIDQKRNKIASIEADLRREQTDAYDPHYDKARQARQGLLEEVESISYWRVFLEGVLREREEVEGRLARHIIQHAEGKRRALESEGNNEENTNNNNIESVPPVVVKQEEVGELPPCSNTAVETEVEEIPQHNNHENIVFGVPPSEAVPTPPEVVVRKSVSHSVTDRKRRRSPSSEKVVRRPSRPQEDEDEEELDQEQYSLRDGNLLAGIGRLIGKVVKHALTFDTSSEEDEEEEYPVKRRRVH
ncbi:hypothetical protein AGDE_13878 [Angomonas deanei]|nr:hypothetical protein AGDE_13878 [Angomonas deanei]|eukprot:EPY21675.1 hypothetical protein AGDE_13878 [Angomonas deanei]